MNCASVASYYTINNTYQQHIAGSSAFSTLFYFGNLIAGSNRPDVTLMALHNMTKTDGQTDGKPVEIIQRIAAGNYQVFGMYLLNDENMTKVKVIKKNHVHEGAEAITQAIMQKWLEVSDPSTSPHTYEHLIECLERSGLGALAEDIVDALGGITHTSYVT